MSMVNLAQIPDGAAYITYENLMVKLLTQLQLEDDDIKEDILQILDQCLKINNFETEKILSAKGIWIMLMLLRSETPSVRILAAKVISSLSVSHAGKRRGALVGAVPVLFRTLSLTNDSKFRAKLCSAISMITVLKDGKRKALEINGIVVLLPVLKDKGAEARMNCLKALTMLADIPDGRKQLLEHVKKVHPMISDPDPEVRKVAEVTYENIIWKE